MQKIKVYKAYRICRCDSCDMEQVYVPVARQYENDGYPHYYEDSPVVQRHIHIIPRPVNGIQYIY